MRSPAPYSAHGTNGSDRYTHRHNGKVERYNRILAAEFLYARTWTSETQRAQAAGGWNIQQVTGRLVWSLGLTFLGYALGSSVPNVDRYLLPMVAVIVALSLMPLAAEALRSRRDAKTKEARG